MRHQPSASNFSGAINAFLGYDTGEVGEKLAGNVSLTDTQLYSEVKERVLDTAGGFVELVGGPREDDDEDDDSSPKPYEPPSVVPDVSGCGSRFRSLKAKLIQVYLLFHVQNPHLPVL